MTQYQKILTIMARYRGRWFFPYDFMKPELGSLFVGYKAPTRIAELAKDHPDIFEWEKDGQYVKRRLKLSTINEWFYELPVSLRKVLSKEGVKPEMSQQEDLARQGYEFADEEKS